MMLLEKALLLSFNMGGWVPTKSDGVAPLAVVQKRICKCFPFSRFWAFLCLCRGLRGQGSRLGKGQQLTPGATQASIKSSFPALSIGATGVRGSLVEDLRFYCFPEQCDRAIEINAAADRDKSNVIKLQIRHS